MDREAALRSMELDGKKMNGRTISIRYARKDPSKRTATSTTATLTMPASQAWRKEKEDKAAQPDFPDFLQAQQSFVDANKTIMGNTDYGKDEDSA